MANFITGFEVNAPASCNKSLKTSLLWGFFVFSIYTLIYFN